MASDDKTYCGRGDYSLSADDKEVMQFLMEQFAVSTDDILNAIRIVGNNKNKVEDYFRNRQNAY